MLRIKIYKPKPVNPIYFLLLPLFLGLVFLGGAYIGYTKGVHIVQIGFALILGLGFFFGGIRYWYFKTRIKGYVIGEKDISAEGTKIKIPFNIIIKIEIVPELGNFITRLWQFNRLIRKDHYGLNTIVQTTILSADQIVIYIQKRKQVLL